MIRFIITALVCCILSRLLCDINPDKYYTWYSGIWHGFFFIPNLLRSWFGDALYKANDCSTAYNVWCGLQPSGVVLGSSLVAVIGGYR